MAAEHVPWFPAIMCFLQYSILITFGHVRDLAASLSGVSRYRSEEARSGLAKLLVAWESFYTRRLYHRVQDVFNRPVAGAPGAHIDLVQRASKDDNKTFDLLDAPPQRCLNLGSYNYLGYADDWMNTCSHDVFQAVEQFSLASTVPPMEFGTTSVHVVLEKAVAKFIGKESAIVYNMGYATNATSIPALTGKGTLILSDALNHTSIVNGARASEHVLRVKIAEGQPRTHRPWKKIIVMIEGIYSMEGEIVHLREMVDVTKKYKAYIYVDEAHSIGALGNTGRGICEYAGVDPSEIDILMGTFSKSFGGMGGYIAASEEIISFIRNSSSGAIYATSLSPVIAQQILTALNIIAGLDGTDIGRKKIASLRDNSNYFRQKLIDMGVITLGDFDSPVIPVMLYHMSKVGEFSRQCLKRNLAVVTVGFPATPLLLARVRFCVSAAHTKEDMDEALKAIKEVSEICHVRYSSHTCG
uniref:serine C-palmitoyltransferase n=1 Tax=Phytophthora ramorum TaxID=164328 RepID=H3GED8_PHYRM